MDGICGGASSGAGTSSNSTGEGGSGGDNKDEPGDINQDLQGGKGGNEPICISVYVTPSGSVVCQLDENTSLLVLTPGMTLDKEKSKTRELIGIGFTWIATLADVVEIGALFVTPGPGEEDAVALYDLGVTVVGCIAAGECNYGTVDPVLPNMITMNQDVVIAGTDFLVGATASGLQILDMVTPGLGWVASNGPDAVTTVIDGLHGAMRSNPFNPQENLVYLGVTLDSDSSGEIYIIIDLVED